MSLTVAVGAAFLVSLMLPLLLKPLLGRLGVVDVPNERSSHTRPATRGAGLAPLVAVTVGYVLLLFVPAVQDFRILLLVILGVSVASGLLGWVEDFRGVPVPIRAALQLIIGLAGGTAVCLVAGAPWWLLPLFVIGIAGYINVANFMDGIDGISGLHGAVVGTSFALIGGLTEQDWMVPAGLVLAVAFVGFLPWNLSRGRIFLGDVGSYLLGGCVAVIAVIAVSSGVSMLAVLGPVIIYLVDAGATLAGRAARGERWYEAHRSHAYQRLTDFGIPHSVVSSLVALMSAVAAGMGMLSLGHTDWMLSALLMALVAVVYLSLPSIVGFARASSRSALEKEDS